VALNSSLLERRVDAQYVTLLLMLWEAESRRLTMANAGGAPPLVCRAGEVLNVRIEGVPLGLLDDREYEEVDFQAEPGDLIILYSDGVQDQQNPTEQEYGRARLAHAAQRLCGVPAVEIVRTIYEDLDQFAETTPRFDDQTLVVMYVR
jgi:sigma-B regulation protein RsbU (phosphoserine phosphatase)